MSSTLASTPIPQRPKPDLIRFLVFNLFFFVSVSFVHFCQLLFAPILLLQFLPIPHRYDALKQNLQDIYKEGMRLTKRAFAVVLSLCSEWFGRTNVIFSADDDFHLESRWKRNEQGEINGLELPERMILISNHQIYADWVYLWWFLLLANLHDSVTITLKASLQYLPILGPGMMFFGFIFLHRNWAKDQQTLTRKLKQLANGSDWVGGASSEYNKLTFLIFPEGALTEDANRVKSLSWAKKIGVEDMRHSLMPRSTGFFHSYKTLKAKIPDLEILDVTIGYEAIPKGGYGQDHYTLQSIFGAGVPPPSIHMHLRLLPHPILKEGSEQKDFEDWLLKHWREKDEMLEQFYNTKELTPGPKTVVPLETMESKNWSDLAWMFIGGFITVVIGLKFLAWSWWFIRWTIFFWW